MDKRLPIFIGGLMRCCVATWDVYTGPSDEGTILQCRYNPDAEDHRMVVEAGGWRWLGLRGQKLDAVPPMRALRTVQD